MAKDKTVFREWLEKLQQESWQLELLISGFAIYGLFNFKSFFEKATADLLYRVDGSLAFSLFVLLAPIYIGIIIFISNLLIHVFIRGLWIGALGLRYVSGDIEYDNLNYSNRFIEFYKRKIGSFDDYIERLEKFASLIFSFTFLLFFIFISAFAFIVYLVLVAYLITFLSSGEINMSAHKVGFVLGRSKFVGFLFLTFILLHLFFGMLVFIDFISLGCFKKVKNRYFSASYFWIYRYFGFVTLSFLLRPILLNFIDDKYTRKFLWLSIPYGLIVGVILPELQYQQYAFIPKFNYYFEEYKSDVRLFSEMYLPSHYDEELVQLSDEDSGKHIHFISLPSKRLQGTLGQAFFKLPMSFDDYIEQLDTTILARQNTGLVSAFTSSPKYSQYREKETAKLNRRLDKLRSAHNAKNKDLPKDQLRELWRIERDHYRQNFRDSLNLVDRQNLIKLKDIMKSSIQFGIDTSAIAAHKLECDFYKHQITGDKGLLCYFPLDSLSIGRHHINATVLDYQVRAEYIRSDTVKISIPFIYEGK